MLTSVRGGGVRGGRERRPGDLTSAFKGSCPSSYFCYMTRTRMLSEPELGQNSTVGLLETPSTDTGSVTALPLLHLRKYREPQYGWTMDNMVTGLGFSIQLSPIQMLALTPPHPRSLSEAAMDNEKHWVQLSFCLSFSGQPLTPTTKTQGRSGTNSLLTLEAPQYKEPRSTRSSEQCLRSLYQTADGWRAA